MNNNSIRDIECRGVCDCECFYCEEVRLHEYNRLCKYGLMTDDMVELAKALGMSDGKHSANSVARHAVEVLKKLGSIAVANAQRRIK
jgi:hypothetical protein